MSTPAPDGATLTWVDNPRILGQLPLSDGPGQLVDRDPIIGHPDSVGWRYQSFGGWGQLSCQTGAQICEPITARTSTYSLAPRLGFTADVPLAGDFPYEIHGLQIGPASQSFHLYKEYDSPAGCTTDLGTACGPIFTERKASLNLRLDEEVMVVPLNVVVVIPRGLDPNVGDYPTRLMDSLAHREIFENYLDDIQTLAGFLRAPSGGLDYFVGGRDLYGTFEDVPYATLNRPTNVKNRFTNASLLGAEGRDHDLGPHLDDVFAQCGVQFRLEQFIVVDETDERYSLRREPDRKGICPGGFGSFDPENRCRFSRAMDPRFS